MLRWTLTILTGVSLGLFAVTLIGWINNDFAIERWGSDKTSRWTYAVGFFEGRLIASKFVDVNRSPNVDGFDGLDITRGRRNWGPSLEEFADDVSQEATISVSVLGFHVYFGIDRRFGTRYRIVAIPLWFVAVLTGAFPLWRMLGAYRRRRAQQRGRSGLCVHCGYDLRSSGDTCPECGTPRVISD